MLDFYNDFKPIRNLLSKLNFYGVLKELDSLLNKHVFVPEVLEFVFINSIIYCPDYGRNNLNDKQKDWNKIFTTVRLK